MKKMFIVLTMFQLITIMVSLNSLKASDLGIIFEQICQDWERDYQSLKLATMISSDPFVVERKFRNKNSNMFDYRQKAVELGNEVTPLVIKAMMTREYEVSDYFYFVISDLTKVRMAIIPDVDDENYAIHHFQEFSDIYCRSAPFLHNELWLKWLKFGQPQIPDKIKQILLRSTEDPEYDSERVRQEVLKFGIFSLPYLMAELEQTPVNFLSIINELTDNDFDNTADCRNWWEKNKDKWTIPSDF